MVHDRPHRPARLPHEAIAELTYGAGSRFDARVVRALADEIGSSSAPHPELAGAVASAIDTAGLPPLRELTGTDPLTLLPGHRAYREAVAQGVEGGPRPARPGPRRSPASSSRSSRRSTAATASPRAIAPC